MTKNNEIVSEIDEAWDWFHNNLATFLQSLLFVSTAMIASGRQAALGKVYSDLKQTTDALGMKPIGYFEANLFFSIVATTELYFQRAIRIVIIRYPQKLSASQFRLSEILESDSLSELIDRAADEYVNQLMYKKPNEYLRELCAILSIPDAALSDLWPQFVEIKARRDVGIHNNWVCNQTYLRKIAEVGITTTANAGQSLIPGYEAYLSDTVDILHKIGSAIRVEVQKKFA